MKNTLKLLIVGLIMTMANTVKADTEVLFETTEGPIKVKLYDDTPQHRDNFLKLVKEGNYDGVLFHRVIKDFMVQTGDPNSKEAKPGQHLGDGDKNYTIEAEIRYPKHYHKYGALAAARTGDAYNPERRSSASQFYIVTGRKADPAQLEAMAEQKVMKERQQRFRELSLAQRDSIIHMQERNDTAGLENLRLELIKKVESEIQAEPVPANILEDYSTIGGTPHLDGQYTVFGEVVEGMDTVEKIQKAETDKNDRPTADIRIISAKILNGDTEKRQLEK